MSTINDTYETEFTVELKIGNIPEHVVITEDLPESFRITVKDKGFNLLRYAYINPIPPLTISYGLALIFFLHSKNAFTKKIQRMIPHGIILC